MRIANDELNKLSSDIWEWAKKGLPLEEAPDDIKEKMKKAKELHWQLKNEEFELMGV